MNIGNNNDDNFDDMTFDDMTFDDMPLDNDIEMNPNNGMNMGMGQQNIGQQNMNLGQQNMGMNAFVYGKQRKQKYLSNLSRRHLKNLNAIKL